MASLLPHFPRCLLPRLRCAVACVLVLAQCVGALGLPVVAHQNRAVRPCGCKVAGPSAACCCGTGTCCAEAPEPVPEPIPEPEEPACPHCREKPKPAPVVKKPLTVHWVASFAARQCHGDDTVLGLVAEFPALAPVVPAAIVPTPGLVAEVSLTNLFATSHDLVPTDPPPRQG